MKIILRYWIIVLGLLFAGCSSSSNALNYDVAVDAINSPNSTGGNSYVLLPGNEGVSLEDLQFQEYSNYINFILHAKGFVKAESFDSASMAIIASYGIGEPERHQYSYSLPVWGQTGVSSSTTTGTVNTIGNLSAVNATTVNTPSFGVIGATSHIGYYTTYFRYLTLIAIDVQDWMKTKKESVLWKTSIGSSGSSGDLRYVFPVLIEGIRPFLAKNTGRKVHFRISYRSMDTDKDVLEMKGKLSVDPPSNQQLDDWRQAANNGNVDAQYNLGFIYHKGDGVHIDYREALKWYQMAAEQGHLKAQCYIGEMYLNGLGVKKNNRMAMEWYQKACAQATLSNKKYPKGSESFMGNPIDYEKRFRGCDAYLRLKNLADK